MVMGVYKLGSHLVNWSLSSLPLKMKGLGGLPVSEKQKWLWKFSTEKLLFGGGGCGYLQWQRVDDEANKRESGGGPRKDIDKNSKCFVLFTKFLAKNRHSVRFREEG